MALEIFKRNHIFSDNNAEDAYPRNKLSSFSEQKCALNEVKNVMVNRNLTPRQFLAKDEKATSHFECSPHVPSPKVEQLSGTKNQNHKKNILDEGFFDYCTPYNGKSDIQIWRELNQIDDSLLNLVLRGGIPDEEDEEEKLPFEKDFYDDIENECSFSSILVQNDSALENDNSTDFDIYLEEPSFSCHDDFLIE